MTNSARNEVDHASPRDHLANERTFLAWLRTAVSLISFGITINRFSLYLTQNAEKHPGVAGARSTWIVSERIGIALVVFGIACLVLAALRFKSTHEQLVAGTYIPNPRMIWLTTIAAVALGGFTTAWLFYR